MTTEAAWSVLHQHFGPVVLDLFVPVVAVAVAVETIVAVAVAAVGEDCLVH